MSEIVPKYTSVLVIGGGPGGSYAAAVLAREGIQVALLEKDVFPRYHIGESMLPSCRQFLHFIDAEDKIKSYGFTGKPGAAVKFNQYKKEGYTDFVALNPENGAWNVIRSDFDEILLRHAAQCGAQVFEGAKVSEIKFKENDVPCSATWERGDGTHGSISFDWLIDASGRSGIVSTKYLRNRKFNKSLKNIAFWSYWKGAGKYSVGTTRENAPWFEALTDETGWAWFIPLHNGTVSVGVVMAEESYRAKKLRPQADKPTQLGSEEFYLSQLQLVPGLRKLLGEGIMCDTVKSAGDYSYTASCYAGPHYRLVGDAGAFIDPFFSSGVHLAFTGALSAASTIVSSIRGLCSEEEAVGYHNARVGTSYTRFLVVVLGAYKQMRSQSSPVLSDIDEDNFDRAFSFLRPIIQGSADADPAVTEQELQDTMDFCKNVFAPTNPEMHAQVAQRLDPILTSPSGPIMDVETVNKLTGDDDEAKFVLWEVNARKPIHAMYDCQYSFGSEVLGGFYVKMEQGALGLMRA